MRHIILVSAFLLVSCTVPPMQHHSPAVDTKDAVLQSALGSHHHPVSTANPEAQRFFDQGLTFIYAFNHDEAIRSFKRAAELDPNLAMAHWGIGIALGPNINLPADPEREKAAYEALQKALSLSKNAPEQERAYIEALAARYSMGPNADLDKLAVDYKNRMGELVKRYPDDLDAATLYAESMMNLRPWRLWNKDGTPAEGTLEIVAVLESVMKRDPNHIGANHYYIHAVEASLNPERALPSAKRLETLVPSAGHLVHMPSHIYIRTGDYEGAAQSNVAGAQADETYIKETNAQGIYTLMYYSHNLHFLSVAHAMQGRFSAAKSAADRLETHVSPHIKNMPMLEFFATTPTLILIRFKQWDDILRLAQPGSEMPGTRAVWHFARGVSYAERGDFENAKNERKLFIAAKRAVPAETMWDLNKTDSVLKIAEAVLNAEIAMAKGDRKSAIEFYGKAIEFEDALNYSEPSGWYIPVRESLGGALMMKGDYAEAEKVFRADLEKNPRSGRSLFGLMESLKAQGKNYEAKLIQREFEAAWKNADTQLRLEDL